MTAQQDVAFVAGATGYTGGHVVRALRARGWTVLAHVRPDSPGRELPSESLRAAGATVDCTPWQGEAMAATLASATPSLVFALLGTTRNRMRAIERSGGTRAEAGYEAVDYGLTMCLLRAAETIVPAPRFVYLSSMGADTTTPNAYLRARQMAEAEIRSSSVTWTIARPGLITGQDRAERRPMERVAGVFAGGMMGLAGALGAKGLEERLRPHAGAELGEALVRLALDPDAAGVIVEAKGLRGP